MINTRIMKYICLLSAFILAITGFSQTPITDDNFYQAIDTCLSTNPVDGLCYNCEYGAMPDWDVNAVTNMDSAFYSAYYFNGDISEWDVSNVTSMKLMLYHRGYFNQDIGDWDVSNVTDMSGMFHFAMTFNKDISNWNVGSVTDMSDMFYAAYYFDQDISSWDVSNVTIMTHMFDSAMIFNHDIGNWDVSNVTDMSNMFRGWIIFNQDIGDWDVSNVTNMDYMFFNSSTFNKDISLWCVEQISTEPAYFSSNLLPEYRPHWGEECVSGLNFYSQQEIDDFPVNYPDISKIDGHVVINDTTDGNIRDLLGLSNLTSIGGSLVISENDSLTSLSGIESLDSIGYKLIICNNNSLTNIANLENITYINANIDIYENASLLTLGGLFNLDTINSIAISDNPLLSSIESIENANISNSVSILNNPNLEVCNIKSICEFLETDPENIIIQNNALDCNSIDEVKELCFVNIPNENSGLSLQYYPNPTNKEINISGINPVNIDKIIILNTFQQIVLIDSNTNRIDISNLEQGIYIIEILSKGIIYRNKIVKR